MTCMTQMTSGAQVPAEAKRSGRRAPCAAVCDLHDVNDLYDLHDLYGSCAALIRAALLLA